MADEPEEVVKAWLVKARRAVEYPDIQIKFQEKMEKESPDLWVWFGKLRHLLGTVSNLTPFAHRNLWLKGGDSFVGNDFFSNVIAPSMTFTPKEPGIVSFAPISYLDGARSVRLQNMSMKIPANVYWLFVGYPKK